ncbi:hypothetical protein Pelo_18693 [Pelomyxa schiedti]|nr:hypothetical protein Pelo_18693 [Pelomyxa schiedti]
MSTDSEAHRSVSEEELSESDEEEQRHDAPHTPRTTIVTNSRDPTTDSPSPENRNWPTSLSSPQLQVIRSTSPPSVLQACTSWPPMWKLTPIPPPTSQDIKFPVTVKGFHKPIALDAVMWP